ncbi:LysM peptidoglycan-binding domain-containing protein [Francisellaceae bacterium]|nr:LysM peptidoglycan-binding domain-containing protein [Francisellaceae bacterium]
MKKLKFTLAVLCASSTIALAACSENTIKPSQNAIMPHKNAVTSVTSQKVKPALKLEAAKPSCNHKVNNKTTHSPKSKHSGRHLHNKTVKKHLSAHATKKTQQPLQQYKVMRGDTLSAIAQKHNLPLKDAILCLKAANKLDHNDLIVAGETLNVPSAQVCRDKYLVHIKRDHHSKKKSPRK